MDTVPPRVRARVVGGTATVEVADRLYLRLDAEARWTAFGEGGAVFRRAVSGEIVRPLGASTIRLDAAEAETVHAWVVRRAGEILEALASDPRSFDVTGDADDLRARLRRAACGEGTSPAEQAKRFQLAYAEPVPILPPHRYRDLVLQPATGCPNHSCTFCAFYRDRPFRALSEGEFAAHLAAVRDLFGAALAERDGIFLGSASALSLPDAVLHDRLRTVREAFGRPRRGVAAFLDPDRGQERTPTAWAARREDGLVEAAIGLETGDPDLREEVGKSGDLDRVRRAVANLETAGLAVSATLLVGLGGEARRTRHREASVAAVARLPLSARDVVYLSPLAESLPPDRLAAEIAAWRDALRAVTPARIGEYRIDRFAWLT